MAPALRSAHHMADAEARGLWATRAERFFSFSFWICGSG